MNESESRRLTPDTLALAAEEYAHLWLQGDGQDLDVDLSVVKWEVSKKMKRAAGKAIFRKNGLTQEKRFIVRLAWRAYEAWGFGDRFKGVIRHELIHVADYQRRGNSDHSWTFKNQARKFNAPLSCERFTKARYEIHCESCDRMVAERLKRSKTVKEPHRYRSKCCTAPLYVIDRARID